MKHRIEKDTMGEVQVPIDAYYGARTRRGIDNFKIASDINRMPLEVIRAFAYLKKAAALTNQEAGVLPAGKCSLFAQVCDEILKRELDDSFPLVVWRTGNGTQSDMNVNEVIANRAHVLNGGKLTDKEKILLPNDDINESQSSNDTFPGIRKLRDTLTAKSKEFMDVVKIGRTHFMDATPLTLLGREFSGYVARLDHGVMGNQERFTPFIGVGVRWNGCWNRH
jgi:fumarate hydratase class II